MMLRFAPVTMIGLLLSVLFGATTRSDETLRASSSRLRDHVAFLASDDLAGRDSGEPGLEIAAEYIANRFAELGLEPAGDNGTFFQHFTIPGGANFGATSGVSISGLGTTPFEWAEGKDVIAFSFGSSLDPIDAPIVFCGYGITPREGDRDRLGGYDDYEQVDVRGKIALVLRFTPRVDSGDGPFRGRRSPYAPFVAKLETAKAHGAVGVIFVTPTTAPDENLAGFAQRATMRRDFVPGVFASQAAVNDLLRHLGHRLETLVGDIDERLQPASFELEGVRARFSTTRRYLLLRNVSARLPGADPDRAREAVVIGGHYDHIGRWGNQVSPDNLGKVHNGADDNASGTAGILEAARLLAAGSRPARSVVFVAFSGEEIGLHGSRHWVDTPRTFVTRDIVIASPPPGDRRGSILWEPGTPLRATGAFEKGVFEVESLAGVRGWISPRRVEQSGGPTALHDVVAMINLDMIGRGAADRPVEVIATGSSPELAAMVEPAAERAGQPVRATALAGGGSDHAHFVRCQIPTVFFHTGLHEKYNTPEDDVDTLDFEVAARIVDIVRDITVSVGNLDGRPTFDRSGTNAPPRPGRPILGVHTDPGFAGPGVRIDAVIDGTPAAKAGIQAGDVILRLGDRVVEDLGDLRSALGAVEGTVPLLVRRNGVDETLKVEFPAP